MSLVQTLLENEEMNTLFESEDGQRILHETSEAIHDFPKVLKAFVLGNPKEFIAENIQETYKNIRVFSEVATQQFITEVTSMKSHELSVQETTTNTALNDYL